MTTTVQPSSDNLEEGRTTDLGFGRAILIGSIAGILVMVAAIALTLHLLDPDLSWAGVIAIAAWTGVWAGLFLGGTVTVGRWSGQNH
ncbi:MAG: hypothetical protein ACXV8G_05370 [Acidimicrobiales bacterium]